MELTARGGGDAIPTLWELAMGVSLEKVLIDAIVTDATPASPVASIRRWTGQRFLAQRAGHLKAVHCDVEGLTPHWWGSTLIRRPVEPVALDAPAAVHETMIDVEPGAYLDDVRSSNDRVGSIIAHAPSETELHGMFELCQQAIRLEIEATPESA